MRRCVSHLFRADGINKTYGKQVTMVDQTHHLAVLLCLCNAHMQVRTQRGVPIHSQLRSHKLFSTHFEDFAHLSDSCTLYHTGAVPCKQHIRLSQSNSVSSYISSAAEASGASVIHTYIEVVELIVCSS